MEFDLFLKSFELLLYHGITVISLHINIAISLKPSSIGIHFLASKKSRQYLMVKPSFLFNLKMGLIIFIALQEIGLLFPAISPTYPRSVVFTCLELVGYMLVASVHYFHHHTSLYSSDPLLLFWLADAFPSILLIRSYITMELYKSDSVAFALIVLKTVSIAVVFMLELFKKNSADYQAIDSANVDKNMTPENHANIFGRLSFYWMTSLMKLGYQKVSL